MMMVLTCTQSWMSQRQQQLKRYDTYIYKNKLYMTFVKRNSHPGEISCVRGHHVDFCCIKYNTRQTLVFLYLPRYLFNQSINQSPPDIIKIMFIISDSSCVSSVGDERTP